MIIATTFKLRGYLETMKSPKYNKGLLILMFLACIGLTPKPAHAIPYSTPGYNVTFYDDNGACNPGTFADCNIVYQLITTISIAPQDAGVFTPFIASVQVPAGADYFSVGFTGYSTPPDAYRGRVAFDALSFSIAGSGNLLTTNPGAEGGTTGWMPFAAVPDFTFESVTSVSFATPGGTILLNPVEDSRFFLIGGPSPSFPPGTGFGGFMNTPLMSMYNLTGDYYTLSVHTAIEAVPEPGTLMLLFTGLVGYFLFKALPYRHNFEKYRIKITRS